MSNSLDGPGRRARRARAAVALIACALLPACSLLRALMGGGPRPPALELYRLSVPDAAPAESIAPGAPLPGALAVAPYVAPGLYGGRSIVFRVDETQYGTYPSREWAIPLGDQLGLLTERVLGRLPLTADGALFDPPSRRAQAYIWRGTVRQFDEADRGQEVFAVVELEAQLIRASDDSVLWTGNAKRERQVQPPTMQMIVLTLSALADEVIAELASGARAAIAKSAASTAKVQE